MTYHLAEHPLYPDEHGHKDHRRMESTPGQPWTWEVTHGAERPRVDDKKKGRDNEESSSLTSQDAGI